MKVVTSAEMQEIDRITIEELGIPGAVLMALAGKSVADLVLTFVTDAKKAAVFCGTGNNGGDGFVIAYILSNKGIEADVYIAGNKVKITGTSRIYYNLCKKTGLLVKEVSPADLSGMDLERYDCIVDALFGTGFSGEVRGIAADLITLINDADCTVVSVDVPSGLGSDGEAPAGEAVIADHTVTIGLPKVSLVTYPGRQYTGNLHVSDIGFPSFLTESDDLTAELMDDSYVAKGSMTGIENTYSGYADTYKNAKGHLLLVGGFDGMEGAIMMTAEAALQYGVGMMTLVTTESARTAIAGRIPELITRAFPGPPGKDGVMDIFFDEFFKDRIYDAVVIGPGLGRDELSQKVFSHLVKKIASYGIRRAVIDGDGLFHLAHYIKESSLPEGVEYILTPHFKEASRLLGRDVEEIKSSRLRAARDLAGERGAVAVLKGPATIISDGLKTLINTSGNAGLATAGSGDVLTGIIGACLLRDYRAVDAAALSVYVHGKSADLFIKDNGPVMKATDITSCIRAARNMIF